MEKELQYLEQIQKHIRDRLQELDARMLRRRDADREMAGQIYDEGLIQRDDAAAELANLTDEMTQNQQQYTAEHEEHTALKRLLQSPYFASISFRFSDNQSDSEQYRIGLMGLSDPDDFTPLVIDWRSPLAAVYYEFEPGPASYESPGGRIEGTLTEKKQIVIRHGELIRMFDTNEEVQDEILQEILSQSASEQMQQIVATLQKDQNRLVRVNPKKTLLIQGAAGSGKTSIAMHRAAYLLYRDSKLKASNILLLTPNEQLAEYVSEVLPNLGEENARQELWITPLLDELATAEGRFSALKLHQANRAKRNAGGRFAMIEALRQFTEADGRLIFKAKQIDVGDYQVPAAVLEDLFFDNYAALPPLKRPSEMLDNIRDYIQKNSVDRGRSFSAVRSEIEGALSDMLAANRLTDLLLRFTAWLDVNTPYKELYAGPRLGESGQLLADDVDISILAYLKIFYHGSELDWSVRHLILDEMQDVYPLAHLDLELIFSCPKTVLGDENQSIHFTLDENYLEQLANLYGQRNTGLQSARLLQAYRSTYEINEFSKTILGQDDILSFRRHGAPVEIVRPGCSVGPDGNEVEPDTVLAELGQLIRRVDAENWETAAVICPDETVTGMLIGALPDRDQLSAKWRLLTISEAKGLEFDAVIMADPYPNDIESESFTGDSHESLVRQYVAATRALHRLLVFRRDQPSAHNTKHE